MKQRSALICVFFVAIIVFCGLLADMSYGTNVITRRLIGVQDINVWDGVSDTFTYTTADGKTLTLRKVGDTVDILGAYGNNVTKTGAVLNATITAIGSNKVGVRLSPGTWSVAENVTFPANITLMPSPGALLSVATGKTVTINGPLEAGNYQIFSLTGTGKVVPGINSTMRSNLNPIHWGADPTGILDSSTAFNNMLRSMDVGSASYEDIYATFKIPAGTYNIQTSLNMTKLRRANLTGNGYGSTILTLSTNGQPGIDLTGAFYVNIDHLTLNGQSSRTPNVGILQAREATYSGGNVWLRNIKIEGYFTVANLVNISQEVGGYENIINHFTAAGTAQANWIIGGYNYLGITSPYVTISTAKLGLAIVSVSGCQFSGPNEGASSLPHNIIIPAHTFDLHFKNCYAYCYGVSAIKFYKWAGAGTSYQRFSVDVDNCMFEGLVSKAAFWVYSEDGDNTEGPRFNQTSCNIAPIGIYYENVGTAYNLTINGMLTSSTQTIVKTSGALSYAYITNAGNSGVKNIAYDIGTGINYSTIETKSYQSINASSIYASFIKEIRSDSSSSRLKLSDFLTFGNPEKTISYAAAVPTTGSWAVGSRIYSTASTLITSPGWYCTASGTFGTLSGVTGSIDSGAALLTVNDVTNLNVGDYISISGVTGTKTIKAIDGLVCYLDSTADATVAGAAVAYVGPPTFSVLGCSGGTTGERPTLTAADVGFQYWDTTLAKAIFWTGSAWKLADGTTP